ncbi:MAG: hypothetical protein K0R66_823 [Gammaproteobacteria bacterium]|jgi:hypothetical protein|nr:hypothetical protein [Gammaproteobacteria bacterium]
MSFQKLIKSYDNLISWHLHLTSFRPGARLSDFLMIGVLSPSHPQHAHKFRVLVGPRLAPPHKLLA